MHGDEDAGRRTRPASGSRAGAGNRRRPRRNGRRRARAPAQAGEEQISPERRCGARRFVLELHQFRVPDQIEAGNRSPESPRPRASAPRRSGSPRRGYRCRARRIRAGYHAGRQALCGSRSTAEDAIALQGEMLGKMRRGRRSLAGTALEVDDATACRCSSVRRCSLPYRRPVLAPSSSTRRSA